ncbi:MAG TPA: amidohydrolase family protein [Acidimicrobiales bacterium]|nr:amidohydrolase family protein [Acidimicrobiales bacterium]
MDGRCVDVRVAGPRIDAVADRLEPDPGEAVVDLSGHLLLPAPAEPHAHLDKALTADRVPNPAGDLLGAIQAWLAHRPTLTVDDIAARAERAVRMLSANGVTAIRTHVDVGADIGTRGIDALLRTRRAVDELVDLQIVVLPSVPSTGALGAGNRAALEEAVAMGVDVVGGCPHLEAEPVVALEHTFELAAGAGRPIDLHTDETLDATTLHLPDIAGLVVKTGFPHQVTASHCVSLGMQDASTQRDVSERVAGAAMAVVTLPQTNLYLQGRDHCTATPRGLTAIRPLLDAGAVVAGGADNLQDPFNIVGRGDPFETAALLVMAGHLTPAEAYHAVSSGSRAAMGLEPVEIAPGSPAELVAVRADSLREAIATAPAGRVVVHRGRLVSG